MNLQKKMPPAKPTTGRQSSKEQALEDAYLFFNEIGIIAQLSSNQFQRALPHGLNQSQFSVLNWFVRVDVEATPGRLARAFQVTRGAMTNTLGKLHAKGLIQIEPDPDSGRRKIVRLTAAGRRARDEAVTASYPLLAEFIAHFNKRRTDAVMPLLQEIREYLDKRREMPETSD
jgi:DNA-binding MarR family transcriptional regulator